jgi:hypothetical protein
MAITESGEARAWDLLAACDPADVCRRAAVDRDPASGTYQLRSFGCGFSIDPRERRILSLEPEGEVFLTRYAYFFRLSALWYLVKALDLKPSGTLVKPTGLSGGEIFFKGSHVLPLEAVAKKYAADREEFLAAGARRGGRPAAFGDAAVELAPLPRVPVTAILWTADEEFPARADLLFDATAPRQLPLDILWSVAMRSGLVLL